MLCGKEHSHIKYITLYIDIYVSANTRHSPNAVSMLGQRRRRWASIETALGKCLCVRRFQSALLVQFLLVHI